MNLQDKMSVLELIEEMGKTGVLGAGRINHATHLFSKMIKDLLFQEGFVKSSEISYIEKRLMCSSLAELTLLMTY